MAMQLAAEDVHELARRVPLGALWQLAQADPVWKQWLRTLAPALWREHPDLRAAVAAGSNASNDNPLWLPAAALPEEAGDMLMGLAWLDANAHVTPAGAAYTLRACQWLQSAPILLGDTPGALARRIFALSWIVHQRNVLRVFSHPLSSDRTMSMFRDMSEAAWAVAMVMGDRQWVRYHEHVLLWRAMLLADHTDPANPGLAGRPVVEPDTWNLTDLLDPIRTPGVWHQAARLLWATTSQFSPSEARALGYLCAVYSVIPGGESLLPPASALWYVLAATPRTILRLWETSAATADWAMVLLRHLAPNDVHWRGNHARAVWAVLAHLADTNRDVADAWPLHQLLAPALGLYWEDLAGALDMANGVRGLTGAALRLLWRHATFARPAPAATLDTMRRILGHVPSATHRAYLWSILAMSPLFGAPAESATLL